VTDRIGAEKSTGAGDDEHMLGELTRLAAEVERALAGSQYRFGASRAYYDLVRTRIAELRERRGLMSTSELKAHHAMHPPPSGWDVGAVAAWLEDAGLEAFAPAFEAAEVDGATLLRLSPRDLETLVSGTSNTMEQNEAAAELLDALIRHLRWRGSGTQELQKQEL
jgi:hypothetical protein